MSGFWESRKAGVEAEARAEAEAQERLEREAREAELAEKSDEDILEELGLPDPESLGEGDDFKQFLSEAVPNRLKTRALRRLWRVNPVLANLDGLLDYGEDFTDSAMVVENMQTAYQVGKGMLKHVEELARQAAEEDAEAELVAQAGVPDAEEDEDLAALEAQEPEPVYSYEPAESVEDDASEVPAPRRRMQFTFEEESAA